MDKIKIVHTHFETPLILSPEKVQVLSIENAHEYYSMVCELVSQMNGGEGNFIFLEGEKEIDGGAVGDIVTNIFLLDLNDKKILNLLYKKLEREAVEKENVELLEKVNFSVSKFLGAVFLEFPFLLTYAEFSPSDIFKSCSVKFDKVYDSLLEKIICYINSVVALKNCRFFVFINITNVMSDEDLSALYEHCNREKISLLFIEGGLTRRLLSFEKAVIITTDLCEILENFE